jgi:hypothetical protein
MTEKTTENGTRSTAIAADELPLERRSLHRLRNEQGTGQGSGTALSRLMMFERWKSQFRVGPEGPDQA